MNDNESEVVIISFQKVELPENGKAKENDLFNHE